MSFFSDEEFVDNLGGDQRSCVGVTQPAFEIGELRLYFKVLTNGLCPMLGCLRYNQLQNIFAN